MKKFAWLLLLLPSMAFAQNNIRWDLTAQTVTGTGQMVPVLALPGAFINFYTNCTNLPCTTAATTYISASSSSTCAASKQVVWQLPLPQACTAQADSQGNFGGYFQPGAYQYTITVSGHVNGPYQFNVGSSSTTSGGCQGPLPGDPTSTNCGNNNLAGNTATAVQTFGYTNANFAPSQNKVMLGAGNMDTAGVLISHALVGVGYDNFTISHPDTTMTIDFALGYLNYNGSVAGDDPYFNTTAAVGYSNFCASSFGNATITDTFVFGETNDCYSMNTTAASMVQHNVIAIGDTAFNVSHTSGNDTYNNMIAIGDTPDQMGQFGSGNDTSHDVIGLGDGTVYGYNMVDVVAMGFQSGGVIAANDVVAIGDVDAGNVSTGGADVVAIGDTNMPGGGAVPFTGHDAVAIGNHDLACLTTGTDNIAIGDYAGSVGYSSSVSCGNSNKTGSHNVWIGDLAGPNTTSQLSNTIGIGFNANNTASNQMVLGNSSMTTIKLFGCPSAGQAPFGDGSGCFTPVVSPLTTKGDIWVFGSADTRLPVGTNGQVLSANSAQTTGLQWIAALTNPMNTLGDIIYGGAAGAATRLGGNTGGTTQCLLSTGSGGLATAPVWGSCAGSAATALSSVTAATGANTIASGNNGAQVWNWAQTTNSQTAFTFGETTAASGTNDQELAVTTIAGSTAIPLTVTQSINGAQTIPALQVLPTWNTSGVVDAGIFENVTNTASGAASKLLDLQVGGSSKMAVDKAGLITNATWNGVAIANAFLANPSTTVNTQTCTLGSTCTVTANTTNSLTMNNGGAGAGSGTTFNGSAAVTLSYNTLGAAPTASPTFTGSVTLPVTGSTQCLQVNSSGVIGGTGAACGSGGGGGFAGTVTYTSSHTLSATGSQCAVGGNDNGCLIIMNCSSACALTLPNPQPTSTMLVGVISKGSSIATITLGSSMTYNGGLTAPVLLSNSQISVASNSSVSTDYIGTTPLKAGSGTTITSSTANQTVAISGSQSTVGSAEVVAFSATPTFSTSFNVSRIVLSGNITSFTMAGAGTDGQLKTLCFEQGGGPYTVAAPANVHGFFTVGTISTDWNCQSFAWDNTDSIWLATSAGVINQ